MNGIHSISPLFFLSFLSFILRLGFRRFFGYNKNILTFPDFEIPHGLVLCEGLVYHRLIII